MYLAALEWPLLRSEEGTVAGHTADLAQTSAFTCFGPRRLARAFERHRGLTAAVYHKAYTLLAAHVGLPLAHVQML